MVEWIDPFFTRRDTSHYYVLRSLDIGCDAITERCREPWEMGRPDWGYGSLLSAWRALICPLCDYMMPRKVPCNT